MSTSTSNSPRRLKFTWLDVFALPGPKPFTGNQLAVVHESEGLEQWQMQTITREFNLSETVFPIAPAPGADHDYSVRIFTPARELPFAGHPSLGSAWSMRDVGIVPAHKPAAIQSCDYGLVTIKFNSPSPELGSSLPAVSLSSPPAFVRPAPALPRLSALGLDGKTEVVSTYVASCGLEFVYVRLKDDDALTQVSPTREGITEVVQAASQNSMALVLYTILDEGGDRGQEGVKVHQRVFPTNIPEDPATGSASLGLGLVLHAASLLAPERTLSYTISQGSEIGHPSILRGSVIVEGAAVKECWIGGDVVKVGEGWVYAPTKQ